MNNDLHFGTEQFLVNFRAITKKNIEVKNRGSVMLQETDISVYDKSQSLAIKLARVVNAIVCRLQFQMTTSYNVLEQKSA